MSYTARQNGSPSYRHLHKPYWFVMGPFEDYGGRIQQVFIIMTTHQKQLYTINIQNYCADLNSINSSITKSD